MQSHANPGRSTAIDTSPGPQLGVGDLDKAVAFYFTKGLALLQLNAPMTQDTDDT